MVLAHTSHRSGVRGNTGFTSTSHERSVPQAIFTAQLRPLTTEESSAHGTLTPSGGPGSAQVLTQAEVKNSRPSAAYSHLQSSRSQLCKALKATR